MSSQSNQSSWNLIRIGLIGSTILLLAAIGSALYRKDESQQAVDQANQVSAGGTVSRRGESVPAAPPGSTAPAVLPVTVMDAKIDLIDGKSKKLSDYSGKVLVVDLWATWCGPCRQEIPHLIEIAKTYKSKGVEVIGLTNEDPISAAEIVVKFSKSFKINYPVGWATPEMQIGLTRGQDGIPQTLIIGRDGKIRSHFIGFNAIMSPPQMKAALDEAIASS